jgi:hypothetical protein
MSTYLILTHPGCSASRNGPRCQGCFEPNPNCHIIFHFPLKNFVVPLNTHDSCSEGTKQGDPVAGFAFCLVEQKLLKIKCPFPQNSKNASTGNRTQGPCLEGKYVTITPPMLIDQGISSLLIERYID